MPLSEIRIIKGTSTTAEDGFLFGLAIMCGTAGLRYTLQIGGPWPPPEAPGALVLIDQVVPVNIWGYWWALAGILCFISSLIPSRSDLFHQLVKKFPIIRWIEALAPAMAFGITLAWGITYALWWLVGISPGPGGNPDSWRTAGLWLGIACMIWCALIASKPLPRRTHGRG